MAAHLPDPDAGRLHLARAQLPERHQIAGVLVAAGQVQEMCIRDRSKIAVARSRMSMCPRVMGSKLPG